MIDNRTNTATLPMTGNTKPQHTGSFMVAAPQSVSSPKHASVSPCMALLAGLLLAALLSTSSAQAQGRNEGWYQVELLVFSRAAASTEEQFPRNIKLAYPKPWVALKDPTLKDPALKDSAQETPTVQGSAQITATATGGQQTSAQTGNASGVDFTREPFWQLPAAERSLNGQANRLVRAGGYHLLFHQAWRQPITSAQRATAIIINGGQTYGKHQQLEGSISLSVATYLKLSTNLWFTDFGVNVATGPQDWPSLPLRPNYVAPETIAIANTETTNPLDEPLADWSNLSALDAIDEPSPYVPTHIVLIKEERDMRSGEVHYLDHPLLGIIIQITPYNASPQPVSRASGAE